MAYLPPLKYRQIGPPMAEYLKQRKNVEEGNVYKRILIIYFFKQGKTRQKEKTYYIQGDTRSRSHGVEM